MITSHAMTIKYAYLKLVSNNAEDIKYPTLKVALYTNNVFPTTITNKPATFFDYQGSASELIAKVPRGDITKLIAEYLIQESIPDALVEVKGRPTDYDVDKESVKARLYGPSITQHTSSYRPYGCYYIHILKHLKHPRYKRDDSLRASTYTAGDILCRKIIRGDKKYYAGIKSGSTLTGRIDNNYVSIAKLSDKITSFKGELTVRDYKLEKMIEILDKSGLKEIQGTVLLEPKIAAVYVKSLSTEALAPYVGLCGTANTHSIGVYDQRALFNVSDYIKKRLKGEVHQEGSKGYERLFGLLERLRMVF